MIAVMDVGSNSVRMMLAEREHDAFRVIERDIRTTRLIAGMRDGILAPGACERTLGAMADFARRAHEAGCKRVYAFATSAMRDAQNRDAILRPAEDFGVQTEVLSGEEEAQLAYMAIERPGRMGVIDIGGGSTELVVGENGRVLSCACASVGAVRLNGEMAGATAAALVARAEAILRPAWETVQDSAASALAFVGISGTMHCLKALDLGVRDRAALEGQKLSCAFVHTMLERLVTMPVEARRALPGMNPDRADVIDCGAAVLCAFFQLAGLPEIEISASGDNMLGYARLRFLANSAQNLEPACGPVQDPDLG